METVHGIPNVDEMFESEHTWDYTNGDKVGYALQCEQGIYPSENMKVSSTTTESILGSGAS